jgi:hypothetical protein
MNPTNNIDAECDSLIQDLIDLERRKLQSQDSAHHLKKIRTLIHDRIEELENSSSEN